MNLPLPKDKILDVATLQRKASDPARSAWVSASAGSGKTKMLADRVTRLLLADVPPQKILCLTFTRAAAAEMSIRLMNLLSDWAICEEEKLDADLVLLEGEAFDPELRGRARRLFARVLSCPGGMRIQTIHAFAQEVLRRFPLEAGLAPQFAVIEEAEAAALKQEAMNEALEEAAEGKDAAASQALAHLSGLMAESSLRGLLEQAVEQTDNLRRAEKNYGTLSKLMEAVRGFMGLAAGEDEESLRRDAVREGAFDRAALKAAAAIIADEGSKTYAPRGSKILHFLAQDEEGRLLWLDDYKTAFFTKQDEPFAKIANKEVLEKHPEIEETIQKETGRLQEVFSKIEAAIIARETESFLVLGLKMAGAYEAKKAARAALDYNDLIHRANELFARSGIAPWVLYKLDGGIDHILVDESQDTSPGQWKIVRTLADEYCAGEGARSDRERTLFVVGDEKQSIFSFQGADPAEFFRMRTYFAEKFGAAQKPFEDVPLNVSFRSAPSVLRAVDKVFADEVVRDGVSHEPVSHEPIRAEGLGRVEVWPLLCAEKPEEDEEENSKKSKIEDWSLPEKYETVHNPAAELAKRIADKIAGWIGAGETVYDRALKAERAVGAGDVMILVRHRGEIVGHLVRELKDRAIPVAGVDRMVLSQQIAVMDLLALLQFALLPQDDLNLATVLRGPLIGASEEDLMTLAIGRKGTLWDSLRDRKEESFALWAAYLKNIAAMADILPPLPMLTRILGEPCPAERSGRRALAARLGPDAEDPIDELLAAASDFGLRRGISLQAFVQDMLTGETEIKRELEQAMGRVRITTVHASKGLEAPIVILPDTGAVPERKRLPKLIWADTDPLPFYVPRETANAQLRPLRDTYYEREMQEYRRLLYVALTRAADRLIVCGFQKKKTLSDQCWYKLVQKALVPPQEEGMEPQETVLTDHAVETKRKPVPPKKEKQKKAIEIPSWAFAPPAPEPSPPRPFTPSRPSEPEPSAASPRDVRFARGRILHRLLQSLPDVEPARREQAAQKFLSNPQHELTAVQQKEMADEILRLLTEERFAPFFGSESRAEVPVVGLVGEKLIAGQVDRLALVGDEVWILDYKTNRPPPAQEKDVPALYRSQMEAYRSVLREIYPEKTIRCFLLWTYTGTLMEIPAGP